MGINIPKEQNMQALAKWLKVDPRWLRYGGVKKDSFVADFMSLSEEDKATVSGVFYQSFRQNYPITRVTPMDSITTAETYVYSQLQVLR